MDKVGFVSQELYFLRTHRQPSASNLESPISTNEALTFVSDCFDYALFVRGIEGWVSPFDSKVTKRQKSVKRYFQFEIGDAIVHRCAIEDSFRIAQENEFDDNKLLSLPAEEAMWYMRRHIVLVANKTKPENISFIHALAFACTLCSIASENGKIDLINSLELKVAGIFLMKFPHEWIYYDFQHWAFAYVFRHKQLQCA